MDQNLPPGPVLVRLLLEHLLVSSFNEKLTNCGRSLAQLLNTEIQQRVWTGTFDVVGQRPPCAGVLDAVTAPGGVELEQPGRGRVGNGGLQAVAAQNHQRILLRVQPPGGAQRAAAEPEEARRLEPQPEHLRCSPAVRDPQKFCPKPDA